MQLRQHVLVWFSPRTQWVLNLVWLWFCRFALFAYSRWWFQRFLFSPLLGEMIQFDIYFSDGLKPPPSISLFLCFLYFVGVYGCCVRWLFGFFGNKPDFFHGAVWCDFFFPRRLSMFFKRLGCGWGKQLRCDSHLPGCNRSSRHHPGFDTFFRLNLPREIWGAFVSGHRNCGLKLLKQSFLPSIQHKGMWQARICRHMWHRHSCDLEKSQWFFYGSNLQLPGFFEKFFQPSGAKLESWK